MSPDRDNGDIVLRRRVFVWFAFRYTNRDSFSEAKISQGNHEKVSVNLKNASLRISKKKQILVARDSSRGMLKSLLVGPYGNLSVVTAEFSRPVPR